jgi:hypothetical protein
MQAQIIIRASFTNSLNGLKDLCTQHSIVKEISPLFPIVLPSLLFSFLFLFLSSLCHPSPSQLGSSSIYRPFSSHHHHHYNTNKNKPLYLQSNLLKMVRPKTNSIRPSLHPAASAALESSTPPLKFTFNPNNTDEGCIKSYDTNIMGKFTCHNLKCPNDGRKNVWTSKKIAITIRLYRDEKYNVRVYHQHCKLCHWVWKPKLDEGCYAARIVYRLKTWSGCKHMEVPPYRKGNGKGPHISKLCEGCKAGRCTALGRGRKEEDMSEGGSSWTHISG